MSRRAYDAEAMRERAAIARERREFVTGSDPGDCPMCSPHACDDPDRHLGIPEEYQIPGCHCGAAIDGRDCLCFD